METLWRVGEAARSTTARRWVKNSSEGGSATFKTGQEQLAEIHTGTQRERNLMHHEAWNGQQGAPREDVGAGQDQRTEHKARPSTAMETFNQAIPFRMKGGSGNVEDALQVTKGRPQSRGELWPPVRSDGRRHAKMGHPTGEEGTCTVSGGSGC